MMKKLVKCKDNFQIKTKEKEVEISHAKRGRYGNENGKNIYRREWESIKGEGIPGKKA